MNGMMNDFGLFSLSRQGMAKSGGGCCRGGGTKPWSMIRITTKCGCFFYFYYLMCMNHRRRYKEYITCPC